MDNIDLKIIKILNKNCRTSIKEIGQEVFLSAPAVKTRIKNLEKEGYITSYQLNLNHSKCGFPIKAYISLEMDPKLKPEFYPFIKACKNVLECDCVTGKYSQMIKVEFETTDALDLFIGQLQRFGQTSTQIVFSTSVEHRNIYLED